MPRSALPAALALLPVVQRVNRLNAELRPQADRNTRFSPANIAGAAIGGWILLAAVAQMIWASRAGYPTGRPPGSTGEQEQIDL